MKKLTLFLLIISLHSILLNAQQSDKRSPEYGTLSLGIKSISFLKDNEYMNPVTEGYTMIGFFIQPVLVYSPGKKFSIALGTQLTGYAGDSRLEMPELVFSSTWNITPGSRIIIGTLDGSDKHLMDDPLFHSEKVYTAFNENGIRIVNDYDHIFSDLWVNWENFIRKGDTTRETFTAGISLKYISSKIADLFTVEVPVQGLFKHYGGQISDYHGEPETFFNASAGIKLNAGLGGGKYGNAGIGFTQFLYSELSNLGSAGIKDGRASWIRFFYDFKFLKFCSSYWKSHDFYAPNGNPIYSSVSDYQDDVIVHDREIWGNSIFLKFTPGGYFEFLAGFETWYDTGFNNLDNAITIHLRFDRLIQLASFR
jgi:hypothetical protein